MFQPLLCLMGRHAWGEPVELEGLRESGLYLAFSSHGFQRAVQTCACGASRKVFRERWISAAPDSPSNEVQVESAGPYKSGAWRPLSRTQDRVIERLHPGV